MRPLAALLLPLLAATAHPVDPDITAQRVLLEGAKQSRGAYALDGSSPLYYAKNATSAGSQRRYHIYLEGGGWCQSTASCAKRAKSALGSSSAAYHPPTLALPSGCVSAAAPALCVFFEASKRSGCTALRRRRLLQRLAGPQPTHARLAPGLRPLPRRRLVRRHRPGRAARRRAR